MSLTMRRAGALCGLAAVVAFVALYSLAMHLDTEYVFMENYLSDLGVREGAWAFNSGVIAAGLLFMVMDVLAVAPALGRGRAATASVALLVLAAAFLMGVGVFTEDAGGLHGFVSYGFFLTMLVALGILSYVLYTGGSLGTPALIATLAALVFGLALLPFGGTPPVETLAVLAILAWGLFMSVMLFRTAPDENPT
jgi:hypothetical membrane protein